MDKHPGSPELSAVGVVGIFNGQTLLGKEEEVSNYRKGYEKRVEFNCNSRCHCGHEVRLVVYRVCTRLKFVADLIFGPKPTGKGSERPVFGPIQKKTHCPACGCLYDSEVVVNRFGIVGPPLEAILIHLKF